VDLETRQVTELGYGEDLAVVVDLAGGVEGVDVEVG